MSPYQETGIPCLVLTHGRDEINRTSLTSIIDCDERLDIDVVHNPSESEDGSFIEFALSLARDGKLRSFTLFDANISNNAYFAFLLENLERYSADRVVVTDGDIIAPKSLIKEQISILDAHADVLACGLRLDASAWDDSLVIKRDFVERFNTSRFEADDYLNTATGMWMTMFRGSELVTILRTLRENGLRLTDANIKQLGAALFQKQWVATKRSVGRELNREQPDYHEAKTVSTGGFGTHSPEPPGSQYATWNHDCVTPATRWTGDSETLVEFPPLPPAVPRFRGPLESDPVIEELMSGRLSYEHGYLANHLMAATEPGLAFIIGERRSMSGLPHLAADRSAVFLTPQGEPGESLAALATLDLGAVLLGREARECEGLLQTLSRFIRPGSLVKGMIFRADAVRHHLNDHPGTMIPHLPRTLRGLAANILQGRGAATLGTTEADALVSRLWSDEALETWLGARRSSLVITNSVKIPTLARFEVEV